MYDGDDLIRRMRASFLSYLLEGPSNTPIIIHLFDEGHTPISCYTSVHAFRMYWRHTYKYYSIKKSEPP